MTQRIRAALSAALNPHGRHDEAHLHLDIDGEVLCEDSRCPLRRSPDELQLARYAPVQRNYLP